MKLSKKYNKFKYSSALYVVTCLMLVSYLLISKNYIPAIVLVTFLILSLVWLGKKASKLYLQMQVLSLAKTNNWQLDNESVAQYYKTKCSGKISDEECREIASEVIELFINKGMAVKSEGTIKFNQNSI
jgi:hypothetical protein